MLGKLEFNMFNLRYFALQFCVSTLVLVLASCAEQPADSKNAAVMKAPEVSKAAAKADKSEAPAKEPESPTIETIPRQVIEEPTTELEPLAAEKSSDQVTEEQVTEQKANEEPKSGTKGTDTAEVPDTQKQAAKPVEPVVEPAAKTVTEPEAKTTKEVPTTVDVEKQKEQVKDSATSPTVSEQVVEVPSDPNTFIVTVGPKAPPHPSLGKGHAMGFLINGVSGKQLVLERGKTYTFDVRTNPKHDVYFSSKEIGWGASPVVEGVEGAFTYKGKITFTPSKSTPDNLYYACRNHPNMGALIHIVNPGQAATVTNRANVQTGAKATQKPDASPKAAVSESIVKQKLMFAEMMINSQGAKRVTASDNEEAKTLLARAKAVMEEGRKKSLVGELSGALTKADESLKLMSEATRLVPSEEALAQLAENYKSLLAEITDYQKSHKNNLERMERSGSVPDAVRYDEAKVASMLSEAKKHAAKNNYVRANAILGDVQKTVTLALHKMLDSQTIVYDLNFETAKDEYEYELKRFTSYEELIPVAIEAKKPAPGAVKLMESFVEKARKRRDQAVDKAKAGEYPDAIAMLQQATKTVRRALRMVGVMQ